MRGAGGAGASAGVVASGGAARALVGAFDCREIFGAVTGRGLPGIGYLSHSSGGRRCPRARAAPRCSDAPL